MRTDAAVYQAIQADIAKTISMNVTPTPAKTQFHVKMISMISNAVAARVMVGKDVTDVKTITIATLVMVAVWAEAE